MKKLRRLRKGLAMLLSLAMVVGLIPGLGTVKVSAEESPGNTSSTVTFTPTAGTTGANEGENYDKLIDGKYSATDGSKWCVTGFSNNSGAYIIFEASEAISVTGYTIVTGNDNASNQGRNPSEWTLYGFNDATANAEVGRDSASWEVIHSISNDTKLEDKNLTSYKFELDTITYTKYKYFKLEIKKIKSGGSTMQMSEFILDYNTCEHQLGGTPESTIAPTCTKGGYDVIKCSTCQKKVLVTNNVAATGHTWVEDKVVEPTCTEAGSTTKKCSLCGEQGETTSVEALGHVFNTYGICTRCKASDIKPTRPSTVDGTAASPYEISTYEELYWFAGLVNGTLDSKEKNTSANAILKNDITVNSNVLGSDGKLVSDTDSFKSWTPIGSKDNIYTGTFNGNGHTISGLYYNDESVDNVGLFGYVGENGNISNVNIADSYFKGKDYVGSICGYGNNSYCTIINCSNTGTVSGSNYVGGVFGQIREKFLIENCYNTGVVTGSNDVGGVFGGAGEGTIRNCYNTGAVTGSDNVGGVFGDVGDKIIVRNCYNTGAVTGSSYVGGVVGMTSTGSIRYCYNTGTINWSDAHAGGVCGGYFPYNSNHGEINNCYYLDTACPEDKEFDFDKGDSKTAAKFASGEVCYLLNNSTIEGNLVWYQTLGTDHSPKFEGRIVYFKNNEYHNCCEEKDHNYGKTEHVDAVCLEAGYNKQTCSICGYVKKTYDEGARPYHESLNGKTCDKCGCSDPTVTVPKQNDAGTYQISTAGELLWFAKNSSGKKYNAELTCDIRLGILTDEGSIDYNGNNIEWTPIGQFSGYTGDSPYKGQFNGKGHSVSGLYIDTDKLYYVGLFGSNNGVVENVCVEDSYFSNSIEVWRYRATVGGICGNNSGTIRNCYNSSKVFLSKKITSAQNDNHYAGGICGYNSGTIENCYNLGNIRSLISEKNYLGGICGYGSSKNSYFLENCLSNALGTINSNDGVKTTAQEFANGSIAYALQGKQSSNIWGQTLNTDDYPVLIDSDTSAESKRVYRFCDGSNIIFSNTQTADTHNLSEAGICQKCGGYEVPGTSDGKYQISKKGHLFWFADYVNMGHNDAKAILTNDITINEGNVANCDGKPDEDWLSWNPIGNESMPYIGTFEGNNHTVTGLYGNGGLFGYLGENGKISEVTVDNSYITGSKVGSICGYNNKGTIENCTNKGTVSGDDYVGGICGYSSNGTINNCRNNGNVSGKGYYGGVCGYCIDNGIIENCHNAGAVSHRTDYTGYSIGGVCGYINGTINNCSNSGSVTEIGQEVGGVCGDVNGTINNCSNSGNVSVNGQNGSGGQYVGGVCGKISGSYDNNYNSAMNYCYNTGTVNSTSTQVGGLCGYVNYGRIENCYNTGAVSGKDSVGGVCGKNNSPKFTNNNYVMNCFNTGHVSGNEGSTKIGGVCGYNDYSIFKCCYYAEGTATKAVGESTDTAIEYNNISISSDRISNGELCYLLNKAIGDDTQPWRQTIDIDNTPNFEGKIVYFIENPTPHYENDNTNYCEDGNHQLKEDSATFEATCTKKAFYIKECTKCSYGELTYTGNFMDHQFNDDTKKCSTCGISKPDIIEPQTDSNGVYQIGTAGELLWFAGLVNGTLLDNATQNASAKAVLTDDIIVGTLEEDGSYDYYHNKVTWTPIANGSSYNYCYRGTFDGQGHSISGLYFNDETVDYVGLFGYAGSGADISNVVIKDSYIKGKDKVGGVCGYNDGKLSNVGVEDSYIEGKDKVGGVCGYYDSSNYDMTNCYNTCAVSGNMDVGGVCGYYSAYSHKITNCYNTGDVSANINVGGVCGHIYRSKITNCHNTGVIRGKYNTGAIGGYLNNNATVDSSYYLADCNAYGTCFDNANGEMKTEEQFRSGEVTYLLNGCKTTNTVWGQNITDPCGEDFPVLGSSYIVYASSPCVIQFSNTAFTEDINHVYAISADGTKHTCSNCQSEELHENVAEFSVDNANHSITANCSCGDLGTVTLSASNYTYDGSENAAAIDGEIKGFATPAIVYEKKVVDESEGHSFVSMDTVPTDAGTYRASITYAVNNNNYSVSAEYIIEKADNNNAPECRMDFDFNADTNTYTANITPVEGAEYAFNDSSQWSDSNTLTGIAHGTQVTGYIRFKEAENYNPSDYVSATLTTGHGNMTHNEAKAPNCIHAGNKEYWRCEKCNANFSDEAGMNSLEDITIPATGKHSYTNSDKKCDICDMDSCSITLYNRTTDNAGAIYDMTSVDNEFPGQSVTVKAEDKSDDGYKFLGWYKVTAANDTEATAYDPNVLTNKLEYTFTINENVALVAVYQVTGKAQVTINVVNGAKYYVGSDNTLAKQGTKETVRLGSKLVLTAVDSASVLHWQNESGKILGKGKSLSLTVTGSTSVTLVYQTADTSANNVGYVQFVSDFGQVIAANLCGTNTNDLLFPDGPSKFGYTFNYWTIDGENEAEEVNLDDIKKAIAAGNKLVTLKPCYSQIVTPAVTITVKKACKGSVVADITDTVYDNLTYGSTTTINEESLDGYVFKCWAADAAGENVLSYDKEYFVQVTKDQIIYAVFVEADTEVKAQPVIKITDLSTMANGSTHMISCAATRNVPDGYTLIEQGMLYGVNLGSLTSESFVPGAVNVECYVSNDKAASGILRLTNVVAQDTTEVYYRAYMIVKNHETGNQEYIYSDITSGSYNTINPNSNSEE